MSWVVLAVVSAVLLGLYDVGKKASLDHNAVLPVLFGCSLAGAALALVVAALGTLAPEKAAAFGLSLVPLDGRAHALVAAKASIVTGSWVCTFFALKHLPLSLAAPIRASAPVFVVLGAVLLFGERPTAQQWAGIGTIGLAYWAFSVLGRAEGISFTGNRRVWLLLLGTLIGAGSGLYDKHLVQGERLHPVTMQFWATLYNAVLQGLLVAFAWWPRRAATTPFRWRWSILSVGVLLLVADFAYFRALALPAALISVVSIIRRSNVVVSFAVGTVLFREQNRLPKAGALAGMLVGLGLLLA